ncbi:MAG: nucleotidyltransferase domain-containing protein [Nanoarchaeota archaeon]
MVDIINNIQLGIISLFRTNYLSQFHIREMAKLIAKSHVSLLPYLKKFEKDNVLRQKLIGKNKVYSLNLDNNQVKEYVSLAEKTKTLEFIKKEFFIKKIYDEFINLHLNGSLILFGSYASHTHTHKSDIDLFYIGEIRESEKNKIKEFGKNYGKKVHLTVMTFEKFDKKLAEQNSLIKEIIKNHIILHNHDFVIHKLWRYYYERKE